MRELSSFWHCNAFQIFGSYYPRTNLLCCTWYSYFVFNIFRTMHAWSWNLILNRFCYVHFPCLKYRKWPRFWATRRKKLKQNKQDFCIDIWKFITEKFKQCKQALSHFTLLFSKFKCISRKKVVNRNKWNFGLLEFR